MKKVLLGLAAGLMLFVFSMSPVSAQMWGSSSATKAEEAPVDASVPANENVKDVDKGVDVDVNKGVDADVNKDAPKDGDCAVPHTDTNANSNHNM